LALRTIGFRFFLPVTTAAIGLAFMIGAKRYPQDLPWTPLSLADQVGRFTQYKIDPLHYDFPACQYLFGDAVARL
jgi:hypothetical protein